MKRNYYLRGSRWSKKKIDKQTKRQRCVLTTNLPLVSVFLIKENGVVSRGVALCSDKDNPDKYIGRWLAYINAVEARDSKKSAKQVTRDEAVDVLSHVLSLGNFDHVDNFYYRADYNPVLTQYENELMQI